MSTPFQILTYPAVPPPLLRDDDIPIQVPKILFRHPGYDPEINVLFSSFPSDKAAASTDQERPQRGLQAQFALIICGIIAGNRWDGSLSESRNWTATNAIDPNGFLLRAEYYFHLPSYSSCDPYPVVPNFRQWRFPHGNLPAAWSSIVPAPSKGIQTVARSNFSQALQIRNSTCRITGCMEETQVSHLVPVAELAWWEKNNMSRYNSNSKIDIDNPANTLLLRGDMHIAFDKLKFVFVPKSNLVIHVLETSLEYETLYHNHEIQPFHCSVPLLFARLAWAIFPMMDGFLINGQRRRLLLINPVETDAQEFVSASQCAEYLTIKQTSKKRKSSTQDTNVPGTSSANQASTRKRKRVSNSTVAAEETSDDSNQHFSASSQTSSHPSKNCSNTDAKRSLAQAWLVRERLRSDQDSHWANEQKWAKNVAQGKYTLFADDAKRYLTITGAEFQDNLKEEDAGFSDMKEGQ